MGQHRLWFIQRLLFATVQQSIIVAHIDNIYPMPQPQMFIVYQTLHYHWLWIRWSWFRPSEFLFRRKWQIWLKVVKVDHELRKHAVGASCKVSVICFPAAWGGGGDAFTCSLGCSAWTVTGGGVTFSVPFSVDWNFSPQLQFPIILSWQTYLQYGHSYWIDGICTCLWKNKWSHECKEWSQTISVHQSVCSLV